MRPLIAIILFVFTAVFLGACIVLAYILPLFRFTFGLFRKLGRRQGQSFQQLYDSNQGLQLHPLTESNGMLERLLKLNSKDTNQPLLMQYMHYADFKRLGQVSKSLRRTTSHTHGVARESIRRATCLPNQKFQCWACSTQICPVSPKHLCPIPLHASFSDSFSPLGLHHGTRN